MLMAVGKTEEANQALLFCSTTEKLVIILQFISQNDCCERAPICLRAPSVILSTGWNKEKVSSSKSKPGFWTRKEDNLKEKQCRLLDWKQICRKSPLNERKDSRSSAVNSLEGGFVSCVTITKCLKKCSCVLKRVLLSPPSEWTCICEWTSFYRILRYYAVIWLNFHLVDN